MEDGRPDDKRLRMRTNSPVPMGNRGARRLLPRGRATANDERHETGRNENRDQDDGSSIDEAPPAPPPGLENAQLHLDPG
jgi:hypothetical protein